MFAASPRLKRLIIHDDIAAILRHVGRPLDEPTVELARLKHFEIEVFHNRNETADVVGLLDLFNLPALQILVIKSVKLNEWMAITDKYNLPVDAFPRPWRWSYGEEKPAPCSGRLASSFIPISFRFDRDQCSSHSKFGKFST